MYYCTFYVRQMFRNMFAKDLRQPASILFDICNSKLEVTNWPACALLMPLAKHHALEHAPFSSKSFGTPVANFCVFQQTFEVHPQTAQTSCQNWTPCLSIWCSRFCCILDICISRAWNLRDAHGLMDLLSSFENVLTSRIEIQSGMEKYINY